MKTSECNLLRELFLFFRSLLFETREKKKTLQSEGTRIRMVNDRWKCSSQFMQQPKMKKKTIYDENPFFSVLAYQYNFTQMILNMNICMYPYVYSSIEFSTLSVSEIVSRIGSLLLCYVKSHWNMSVVCVIQYMFFFAFVISM